MIIGVSGYARSGKDTIAEVLIMNYGFKRLAFADNIRKAVKVLDPILENGKRVNEMVKEFGWEITKAQPEMRRLLQVFGTEVGRDMFGENFWVDQVFRQIEAEDRDSNFIITDVRYPNEADLVRKNGGQIWRVNRSVIRPINGHSSEFAMDNYDFDRIITNDSDIKELESHIFSIMRGN